MSRACCCACDSLTGRSFGLVTALSEELPDVPLFYHLHELSRPAPSLPPCQPYACAIIAVLLRTDYWHGASVLLGRGALRSFRRLSPMDCRISARAVVRRLMHVTSPTLAEIRSALLNGGCGFRPAPTAAQRCSGAPDVGGDACVHARARPPARPAGRARVRVRYTQHALVDKLTPSTRAAGARGSKRLARCPQLSRIDLAHGRAGTQNGRATECARTPFGKAIYCAPP